MIDRHGIRYSHPDPALIGQRVAEPVVALDGRNHLGIDHGNLGPSANAKAPLRGPPGGQIVGEVSAGILERRGLRSAARASCPRLLLYFALRAGDRRRRLGDCSRAGSSAAPSAWSSTRSPALVQEREAMLHGIREGVITVDRAGRVTLVNDEARRLLALAHAGRRAPARGAGPRRDGCGCC